VGAWRSESLWGIRTAQDVRSSLDVFRGRRPVSHSAMLGAEDAGTGPDAAGDEAVRRMLLRERARFEKQARSVRRQQANVLALRSRLQKVLGKNAALQQARAALLQERRAELMRVRDDFRDRHRAFPGRRSGRAKGVPS
jgi:delta 1-pyrroline-5-carboxylate dehydrogenase